jgi:hypothetical protein
MAGTLLLLATVGVGCDGSGADDPGIFENSTDKTNAGADHIGSAACLACHGGLAEADAAHGHAWTMSRIKGQPPEFPESNPRAGVPSPPEPLTYDDVAFVIGGYDGSARFVDLDGYLVTGEAAEWVLDTPVTATTAGFVPFAADATEPLPLAFERFRKITTGAMPLDPDAPRREDNRPGIEGTWAEEAVRCEACHGPGSNHAVNPAARDLFVDPNGDQSCNLCHTSSYDPVDNTVQAANGFIQPGQQRSELLVTPHAGRTCTICHDPHVSSRQADHAGIRNGCSACHPNANMARHAGKTYTLGAYEEALTCESCHMPFAVRQGSSLLIPSVNLGNGTPLDGEGRIGDQRSHVVSIAVSADDFESAFTPDGSALAVNANGYAALTLDFVCLRCHNGQGSLFGLSLEQAARVAPDLHRNAEE